MRILLNEKVHFRASVHLNCFALCLTLEYLKNGKDRWGKYENYGSC